MSEHERGLGAIIREGLDAIKRGVGLSGNLTPMEEPIDQAVWMPIENACGHLGKTEQMISEELIRSGKLKSTTRTYKYQRTNDMGGKEWAEIIAVFVDRAQVKELYEKSIHSMTTVVEGSQVRIESSEKSIPPIVVEPGVIGTIERTSEWVPWRLRGSGPG